MKLDLRIAGRTRRVEIERRGGHLQFRLDGRELQADTADVAPGIYSVLLGGESFDVRVGPRAAGLRVSTRGREFSAEVIDPRQWRRERGRTLEVEGSQEIVAPMPGKVVRVLVKAGDKVETGQGLLVVEAMKMQNEIKSPKSGKVERLFVREGQTVNAGEVVVAVA